MEIYYVDDLQTLALPLYSTNVLQLAYYEKRSKHQPPLRTQNKN